MATLKDVAIKSGYSMTTVSRALNNFDDVNEETKKHIRNVANELNYQTNFHAKSLAMKKSNRIGFIIFEFGIASGEDNFVYELMIGMQKYCLKSGYELLFLFGSTHFSDKEEGVIKNIFSQYNLEGLIIMGCNIDSPAHKELKTIDKPIVWIDGDFTTNLVGCVTTDNKSATKEMVDYVISNKNRKKIMLMNGKQKAFASIERKNGYVDSLGEHFDENDVFYGQYSESKSIELTENLIKTNKFIYDAVICSNDMMAIGVIKVLKKHGYKIGEDVDVTGFDNIVLSQYIEPSLTTVNQDKQLMGKSAILLLLDIINNKAKKMKIVLPYTIVRRGSA